MRSRSEVQHRFRFVVGEEHLGIFHVGPKRLQEQRTRLLIARARIVGQRDGQLVLSVEVVARVFQKVLSDGQDANLRWIDDSRERSNTEHAEIGDGERATLKFVRLEFAILGLGGQLTNFSVDVLDG